MSEDECLVYVTFATHYARQLKRNGVPHKQAALALSIACGVLLGVVLCADPDDQAAQAFTSEILREALQHAYDPQQASSIPLQA